MGNNAIIFQAGGVILLLFFCFLTYLNTKSWRALHVTFMFFCFGAAVAFAVYGAMVLKTRRAWQEYAAKAEKNLLEAESKLKKITDGDQNDVPQKPDNIRVIREETGRLLSDRGRVWRECRPTNVAPDAITVNTTPANLPEGVAPPPNKIEEKLVLYAFKEINSPIPDATKVPAIYLGKFRVTTATPDSVTLAPLHPYDAQQQQHLQGDATWSLYELLPVDDYAPFADLTDDQIRGLLPADLLVGVPPPRLEALHTRYIRTGKPAADSDGPSEVWWRVKFKKEHTIDVDSPDAAAVVLDGGFFDSQGRAVVQRLKLGENKVTIGETTLLFGEKDANQLVDDGIADKVEKVYLRPLNDYGFKFTEKFVRETAINHRLVEVKRDLDTMNSATAKAEKQIKYREGEKTKVEEDLAKVKYESAEVGKYLVKLEQRNATLRAEMSDLYRQNRALLAELTALNTKLTDEINTRTQQAAR